MISLRQLKMCVSTLARFKVLCLLLLLGFAFQVCGAEDRVVLYSTLPGAAASTAYSLEVNGQRVFVEKFGDVSYARFAFSGTANLVVEVDEPILKCLISPQSLQIPSEISGNRTSFSLTLSGGLVVMINGLERLIVIADPVEADAPKPTDLGVVNVASFLPEGRNPDAAVTREFQSAIDNVSNSNGGKGGVLYVPDGLYVTTQLKLKSNVHLYLESGAMLKAARISLIFMRPFSARSAAPFPSITPRPEIVTFFALSRNI